MMWIDAKAWLPCMVAIATWSFVQERASAVITSSPSAELENSIRRATLVVHGVVSRISANYYIEEDGERTYCGTNYSVDVEHLFKGEKHRTVVFAENFGPLFDDADDVKVGDELLLLLTRYRKGSEPSLRDVPDHIPAPPSAARLACLNKLSDLRLLWHGEFAFRIERPPGSPPDAERWLVYEDGTTLIPNRKDLPVKHYTHACYQNDCSKDPRRRVPWLALKKLIESWALPVS